MKKRADGRYRESLTIDGKRKYVYGSSPAEVKKKLREFTAEKPKGRFLTKSRVIGISNIIKRFHTIRSCIIDRQ